MSAVDRQCASEAICQHIEALLIALQAEQAGFTAPVIAAFWPLADEPDLRAGMTRWAQRPGWRLALPCVAAPAQPLLFHAWTPTTSMRSACYGIQEPVGTETLQPTVVLTPGLGFTRFGDRIGYGGGFYDRTLAHWARAGVDVVKVGVMFACSEIDALGYQPQAHDQALDWVVTENETLRAQRRGE